MKRQAGASSGRSRGRPPKRCACTEDDFEHVARQGTRRLLMPGPSSREEVALWPQDLVKISKRKAAASGKQEVMQAFFRHGLFNTSDYSGFDGPREMLTQVFRAFLQTQSSSFSINDAVFRVDRACDNSPLPQSALCWIATELDGKDSCVMTDIMSCLTRDAQEEVSNMVPHQGKTYSKLSRDEAGDRRWVRECPEVAFGKQGHGVRS